MCLWLFVDLWGFFLLCSQYFNLKLSQFGPYRLDYSRTGRSVSSDALGFLLNAHILKPLHLSTLQTPGSRWEERPCCLHRLAVQAADVRDKRHGDDKRCQVRSSVYFQASLCERYFWSSGSSALFVKSVSVCPQVAPQWSHVCSGSEKVALHLRLQRDRATLHPQV